MRWGESSRPGCKGRELHRLLVDVIRIEVPVLLREGWFLPRHGVPESYFGVVTWELLQAMLIQEGGWRDGRRKGNRVADVLFIYDVDRFVPVEIGRCEFERWAPHSMLHVSFDLGVSTIRWSDDDDFLEALEMCTCCALGYLEHPGLLPCGDQRRRFDQYHREWLDLAQGRLF
jgi:hypothetical protein